MSATDDGQPSIAFVIATLDEVSGIEACVRSLLDQAYPAHRIEVAVVDGGSKDGTVDVVETLAAVDARVRLFHNPKRVAPSAFNIGIAGTAADIVSLVSAHSTLDHDYARVLADAFATSGAALVGGRMEAEASAASGPMAQAIVRATSSPFGLGSAKFHYADEPGWVDTAFPGAYRRTLLDEIGGFDESLVRNQDDELHLRARLHGHPMWFDPRLRSRYRPRQSIAALWRQYFEYGWWRVVTMRKHHMVASSRHIVPAALVAGIVAGPVLALAPGGRWWRRAWFGGVSGWVAVLGAAGAREVGAPPSVRARVPVAVACLHLAYGSGFWGSVLHEARASIRRRIDG